MLRKTFFHFLVFLAFAYSATCSVTMSAVGQEPAEQAEEKSPEQLRQERREQRQRNNPFPNGPPPGTIGIMVRAGANFMQKGGGNTFMLVGGGNREAMNQALGLDEEKVKEFEALRNELRGQMLQKMPQYANRLMKMTPADHAAIQADVEKEFQAVSDRVDKVATPEIRQSARKLMFQATGGLDSPLINPDTLETLNLTKEQREKALATFKEMEPERKAQLEELIGFIEKHPRGPGSLPEEERKEFEAKMEALMARALATGKKLGDSLRRHLTDEQRDLAEKLMADRPGFLGPLPPQMRGETESEYRPGPDSWKPGQGAPTERDERKRRPFPLTE